MKTLLTTFLLIISIMVYSQKPYKPLRECNNDPIAYIDYNFRENKGKYIGKPMQMLLDELDRIDIEIMTRCFYVNATGPYRSIEEREKINGLYLEYLYDTQSAYYDFEKIPYYTVLFSFKVPPYTHDEKEFWDLTKKNVRQYDEVVVWGPDFYNLFKDYIIEEITIFKNNIEK